MVSRSPAAYADSMSLIEDVAAWAPLGALATADTWKRVHKSRITLDEARRWTTAGLAANFAAAAAQCDAALTDVLELVEAYQAGLARAGQPAADLKDWPCQLDRAPGGRLESAPPQLVSRSVPAGSVAEFCRRSSDRLDITPSVPS